MQLYGSWEEAIWKCASPSPSGRANSCLRRSFWLQKWGRKLWMSQFPYNCNLFLERGGMKTVWDELLIFISAEIWPLNESRKVECLPYESRTQQLYPLCLRGCSRLQRFSRTQCSPLKWKWIIRFSLFSRTLITASSKTQLLNHRFLNRAGPFNQNNIGTSVRYSRARYCICKWICLQNHGCQNLEKHSSLELHQGTKERCSAFWPFHTVVDLPTALGLASG